MPHPVDRDPTPPQLASFRNRLANLAATYLIASDAAYSARVLQAGLPESDEAEKSLGSASERFTRYRELLTTTMDVEIGVIRLNAAVEFLCMRPPDNILSKSGTSYGVWIDTHIGSAAIAMMALFDRVEALLQQAHRRLVLPFSTTAPRESPLVATLRLYTEPMKPLRDPYAHKGGAAEWLAPTGRLDQYVLHKKWPLIESVIEHHQNSAESVCERMRVGAQLAVQAVESVLAELSSSIPWDQLTVAATKGRISP